MSDLITNMESFGMLRYSIDKIMIIVEPDDPKEFKKSFNNKNSEIRKSYEKGKAKGDFILDQTLFGLIKTGDLQAYDRLMTRIMMNEENM